METIIIPVVAVASFLIIGFLVYIIGILIKEKTFAEKNGRVALKNAENAYADKWKAKEHKMYVSHKQDTELTERVHQKEILMCKNKLDEKASANAKLAMEKANLVRLLAAEKENFESMRLDHKRALDGIPKIKPQENKAVKGKKRGPYKKRVKKETK